MDFDIVFEPAHKLVCFLLLFSMAFDLGVGNLMNEEALSPWAHVVSHEAAGKGCIDLDTKGKCDYCDRTGRYCESRFPGLKVEWPELKGVPALQAKSIIERDNPNVKVDLYIMSVHLIDIICCNRVILRVPDNNCHNGPVLNKPQIG